MPYAHDIPEALDPDGELPVIVALDMSNDAIVYIRESDLRQMMKAFGYQLCAVRAEEQSA